MRTFFLLFLIFSMHSTSAQVVSTLIKNSGVDDAIILGPEGCLYGARYQGSAVRKIDLRRATSEVFSDGYNTPNGMAYRDGWIYLADNRDNRIYRISADGSKEVFIDNFYNPSGLIFAPNSDTLIITSYLGNKIVKAGADGGYIDWTTGIHLDGPVGLCYDDKEQLYVGNFNDRLIIRLDKSGIQTRVYQPPGIGSLGFITYAKGYIYGTLFNQHKIFRTDLLGNGENILGSTVGNNDGNSSEAKFNSPNGIFATSSQDTLFVSDYGSRNIRVITKLHPNNTSTKDELIDADIIIRPNPTNERLSVSLDLIHPGHYDLQLMNVSRKITNEFFQDIRLSQGLHQFEFDIENIPSGNYFLVLTNAKGGIKSLQIVIL